MPSSVMFVVTTMRPMSLPSFDVDERRGRQRVPGPTGRRCCAQFRGRAVSKPEMETLDSGLMAADGSDSLLARAQRGDPDAFGALVAPYRTELLTHCYRMLGSLQDAEDALQDSLVAAWKGLPSFEGRSS